MALFIASYRLCIFLIVIRASITAYIFFAWLVGSHSFFLFFFYFLLSLLRLGLSVLSNIYLMQIVEACMFYHKIGGTVSTEVKKINPHAK
jgi:hypothetical protein